MNIILYTGILFGALLALVLALGQLVLKNKQAYNYLLALLFINTSLWLGLSGLLQWFYINNKTICYTSSIYIITGTLFLTAPLLYYYFNSVINNKFKFKIYADGMQLFLAGIVTIIYIIFVKNHTPYTFTSNNFSFENILIAGVVYIFISLTFVISKIIILIKNNPSGKIRVYIGTILLIIYLIFTIFLRIYYSWEVSCFAVSIFLIILYLIGQRNFGYLHILKLEAEKVKYAQSQLGSVNLELIDKKLNGLLLEKKIYCDENLNLKILAEEVKLTPHQLSEFINVRYHKTYNQYINSFRINEAIRLFKEEPEAAILSIAYQAGFNSSSVFYSAFKDICGLPPAEYRKRLLGK